MKEIVISEILKFLDDIRVEYHFTGNKKDVITGFSSFSNYTEGTITWMGSEMQSDNMKIRLAVVQSDVDATAAVNAIITNRSKYVFFSILENFYGTETPAGSIGKNTYISSKVKLGNNVTIGHNCTLDGDILIGDNTKIYNNVNIINHVIIGANCEIQSCVNIGHDGFGFSEDENHVKTMVKHYGGVIIGDDVYIGGNSYIERGTIDNTIIASGTKIDGMCIVGHNSVLGENVAMVGGSILLGSVTVGNNAYIASGMVRNKATVGENALIGMGSVVTKDVDKNTVVAGVPARYIKEN